MEYNKNRFQKTNDKKILHKVKKQWVVLSVALLAALGGGATVATTHASANANGANGQNNDQETTIKNRINQNLKTAQSQGANNNASQGQTKQVNVNSLSSDQITKQANLLHNQMLLGATQGTNPKTANGRQAARKNARVNRVNANTSAAASVANRKPAANANHSRMFGAAAPSANFGAMRKPEMRLGAIHGFGDTAQAQAQAKSLINPKDVKKAFVDHVRVNSNADTQGYANYAYDDLLSMASLANVKSVANNGMEVGSDSPSNSGDNWIGQLNRAKNDLDTINRNNSGMSKNRFSSADAQVDSLANRLYNSSISSNVSVSKTLSDNDVNNQVNLNSLVQSDVNSLENKISTPFPGINTHVITISSATASHVTGNMIGNTQLNDSINDIINNGKTVQVHVTNNDQIKVTVNAQATIPDRYSSLKSTIYSVLYNNKAISNGENITFDTPFDVTHTVTIPANSINATVSYPIKPLASDNFNAYDIATMLDGQNPTNNSAHGDKNNGLDNIAGKVIAGKANPAKRSNIANNIRDAINTINNDQAAGEYQQAVSDAYKLSTNGNNNNLGGNESAEQSALNDMSTQLEGIHTAGGDGNPAQNVSGVADYLSASNASSSVVATVRSLGDFADQWAGSMSTDTSEINSASASASTDSGDVSNAAANSFVKSDSAASATVSKDVGAENSASNVIAIASSAYSSNADLNSSAAADASTAAVSASSASSEASKEVVNAESSAIASASSAVNSELSSANSASTKASASNVGDSNTSLTNSLSNDIKSLTSASGSIHAQSSANSADANNDSNSASTASTAAKSADNAVSSINSSASSNSTAIANDQNTATTASQTANNQVNSSNVAKDSNSASNTGKSVSGAAQSYANDIASKSKAISNYAANSNSAQDTNDKGLVSDINKDSSALNSLVSDANSSKATADSSSIAKESSNASSASGSKNVKADSSIASQFSTDQSIINSASGVTAAHSAGDLSADDKASSEASMANDNLNSLVNDANASASEAQNLQNELNQTPENYTVPIHIVYEDANGSEEQRYDQSDNQYISNSDTEYVMVTGYANKSGDVNTYTGSTDDNGVRQMASTANAVGNGAELYNNDASDTRHALGDDSNYSLFSISDVNGNTQSSNNSLGVSLTSNGNWTWLDNSGSALNQSVPTFYYRAKSSVDGDINVQYINQNGYKVNAVASSGNMNNAAELTTGSVRANERSVASADQTSSQYSGDVNYMGKGQYGNTIDVLAGLSSVASASVSVPMTISNGSINYSSMAERLPVTSDGSGSIYSTTYSFGFKPKAVNSSKSMGNGSYSTVTSYVADSTPSYSDYAFQSSEQTVTLPIHGQKIDNNTYPTVNIQTAVRDHRGSFVSSNVSANVTMSTLASMAHISGPVHYGDLIKVDPQEFAKSGEDVASSDYNVDPHNTSSDNTGQNVPEIYISETGPKWISIDNRQNAVPSDITDATSVTMKSDVNGSSFSHTTPRGYSAKMPDGQIFNEPFTDNNAKNTITFNYIYGQHEGTTMPIHVTYRDQNNNVVQEGMINPTGSNYGDMINIPSGTNITNTSATSMFGSGTTLPSGYILDTTKDGTGAENYIVNSDWNAISYSDYKPGTNKATSDQPFTSNQGQDNIARDAQGNPETVNNKTNVYAGNNITLYVRGQYHTTTNGKLLARVKFVNSDNQPIQGTTLNSDAKPDKRTSDAPDAYEIPLYLNNFNGNSEIISPSDFEPQAQKDITPQDSNNKSNIYDVTPSDLRYKVTFNGNGTITTQALSDNGRNPHGAPVTSKINGNKIEANSDVSFVYRAPTNKVAQHTVNVHYFYSDLSDVPDKKETPISKNHVIPLDGTTITENVQGSDFNLNPYMANPPKGYQFVTVMNDSDTTKALKNPNQISGLSPTTRAENDNTTNNVALSSDGTDNIDIKLVPTSRGITFHYYDQNGNPVHPDSDNDITDNMAMKSNGQKISYTETNGQDFTNSDSYQYRGDPANANNVHTEFGNILTQYNADGGRYYSRYGQLFNVSDIPVPSGYHISHKFKQGHNRYYRFTRNHQDVDVMVVGNQDDVSNDPKHAGNPTVTSGDTDNKGTSATVYYNPTTHQSTTSDKSGQPGWNKETNGKTHQDADTIWVTIHEMDPQNHQIRQYMVPSYITGDTGDQFHIYASDFTPDAQLDESGNTEYYYTPYAADHIHDTGATPKAGTNTNDDNYIMAEGNINPDGTIHAYSDTLDGTTLNTPNHVDFYYHITNKSNLKPINVTYMDGSKAVGYKQIVPSDNINYPGETVSDTINNTYNGHNPLQDKTINGDTKKGIPNGYVQVQPSDTYPTSFDVNHDQDIIIPVRKNGNKQYSDKYIVIDHFYSGVDGGMNSLVADSLSTVTMPKEYSGQQNFVSGSATSNYSGDTYSAGSENSTADVIATSDGATPNIVNFNYYSSASSMNPSKTGSQSTKAASTAQPIYVQYFTGGSAVSLAPNQSVPSGDYLLGSDTELTGVDGESYSDVTNNVPVPAGYHLDPSDQNVSYTIGKNPYQVDLHVTRDHDKDGQFPLTIIVQDANGNQISSRTRDVYVPKNGSTTINDNDYNPNSNYLNPVPNDDYYIPNGTTQHTQKSTFTVHNQSGKIDAQSGTLVYKMNTNNPSDIKPITVQYIDQDTGSDVPAKGANDGSDYQLNGNYFNQNMSDVTTQTGQIHGTSTVPTGYELVNPNQNLDYHIQHNGQNVVVLLKKNSTNPNVQNDNVTVNVVEIDKNAGTYTYLPGVETEKIYNNTTFDPHNYIPMSDYTTVNSSNKYGPNSTAYYVDPADHNQIIKPKPGTQSITYFYDKGHQHNYSGAIVLNYYDQNGKHVGYTDYINGKGTVNGQNFDRYGQKINVQNSDLTDGNNNNSVGENTPKGYLLDSDQNVNYTFNNDTQYVNLYVHGKTEQYPLTVRIHEENGDQPSDVFSHTYEVNEPAGNNIPLDPRTYTPAGYQVEPSDNHVQNVKVNSDGLTPNTVDFYYNKDNNLFTKPYIVRYVNQNGKRVGYSDVVSNPDIIKKSDVDLTNPDNSDGGEAVPAGYKLESDYYQNQPVHDYRFGNNHIITLKVTGDQATVPMKIYMVEKSPDGRNSDATHVYTTTEEIKGQIGSSDHFLNADQYWNDLPNKDKYTVDPGNNAKQVTIEEGANGPYLSIHEWNNGHQITNSNDMTDNQAVFYYDPATNEKPAPIYVHYLDENTGQEISSGEINPSDDNKDTIGTQISDVTNVSGNKGNLGNKGIAIPDGYTKDNALPSQTYNATFMGHDQNVYIPLKPDAYSDQVVINTFIKNTQGSVIGSSSETKDISAAQNSTQTYSPYDYIPTGHGNLYATASDNDAQFQVEPNRNKQHNDPYVINWNYTASTNASQMQVGTINVHYVTKGQNNGQNIQIIASNDKGTGYYQVDQESDHGLSDVPFYLSDYLNDIPSYRGNYYHLDNSVRDPVIGYNNIHGANTQGNDDNPITYSHPLAQQGNPTPYYFRIGGAHLIFGDSTYAPTTIVDGHTEAQNTQDIYVLVAPNTDKPNGFDDPQNGSNNSSNNETPDNEGNGDTGNGKNFNLWNNATLD